ncbi:peptidoglycan DD-metalloendopeptidase family protein [Candidatus Woesearchaeota archaeon]|jgi:peptidoglycan LD-endopeptidase LytH|nr:peptidoglycan DD-metalloendopeptidase family protein [Candidatus Woesearchaeota archaeon]
MIIEQEIITIRQRRQEIVQVLKNAREQNIIKDIISVNIHDSNAFIFNFQDNNQEIQNLDIANVEPFNNYIFQKLRENNTQIGFGRFDENRTFYGRCKQFQNTQQARTIHLGVDLWVEPGTRIFAPLNAKIHSFQFNNNVGDYGPTIILEHELGGIIFYTLYGHLTTDSIKNLNVGQNILAGQEIAKAGIFPQNGNWPPHLHFQIITDMQSNIGDFPGVCSEEDRERFLEICLDPNLILNIERLK